MEILLLALVFMATRSSGDSSSPGQATVRGTIVSPRAALLNQRIRAPVRRVSSATPPVTNKSSAAKSPDAPSSINPETGEPEVNWGQAGANCLQGALSGGATGGVVGAAAGGVGAGPGAIFGALLGCGAGVLHEIANPSGRK